MRVSLEFGYLTERSRRSDKRFFPAPRAEHWFCSQHLVKSSKLSRNVARSLENRSSRAKAVPVRGSVSTRDYKSRLGTVRWTRCVSVWKKNAGRRLWAGEQTVKLWAWWGVKKHRKSARMIGHMRSKRVEATTVKREGCTNPRRIEKLRV